MPFNDEMDAFAVLLGVPQGETFEEVSTGAGGQVDV